MRKFAFGIILAVVILWAAPSQACEDCSEYFNSQNFEWCYYCHASYCGFFNCWIQSEPVVGGGFQDVCAGDAYDCFEYGGGCVQEPVMRFRRLDETWRLARVRINQPRSLRAPVTTKATPIINKKG